MKHNKNLVATRVGISRATVLALLAGLMTACNQGTSDTPDVVVVTPSNTAVSPSPQTSPTSTTAVSPSPQASTTTTTTTTKTVVIKEPITEVVTITSAPQPQTLVNKRVQFTSTKVLSVIGDRPFWVGRSNNERLVVVLDPALDKGGAENKVVVKAGQTLDVTGVLKPMPSPETAQQQWGLSASEAQGLQAKAVYLQADKINFK